MADFRQRRPPPPPSSKQNPSSAAPRTRDRSSSSGMAPLPKLICAAVLAFTTVLFGGIASLVVKEYGMDFSSFAFGPQSLYPSSYPSSQSSQIHAHHDCYSSKYGYTCNRDITRLWAQYSPYFSSDSGLEQSSDASEVRKRCKLTHVQAVYRHGSRVATATRARIYEELITRLKETVSPDVLVGKWVFFRDYKFGMIPQAGLLTKFGQQEMYRSGKRFYDRYGSLIAQSVEGAKKSNDKSRPGLFVRAGDLPRVVMSAQNFSDAFYASVRPGQDVGPIRDILRIPETDQTNNTLHHSRCDVFEGGKSRYEAREPQIEWGRKFIEPVARRISAELGNVPISNLDVVSLMELCAFETSAQLADNLHRLHDFCGLFSVDEYRLFDYYHSLGKYYAYGPGSELGASQGVGLVREMIARMTNKPVEPAGSVNATLDADFGSFPYGPGWSAFADFSHDNDMIGLYAALKLFQTKLPRTTLTDAEDVDGFAVSRVTSFGARMYLEKWDCGEADETETETKKSKATTPSERVMVSINERVIPIKWCAQPVRFADGQTSKNPSTCRLQDFVDGIMKEGDYGWEDSCYL